MIGLNRKKMRKLLKKAFLFIVLVPCLLNAQPLTGSSETEYEDFFKTNISNLDPIEGVYSCQLTSLINCSGTTASESTTKKFVIVRDGKNYKLVSVDNSKQEGKHIIKVKIRRLGETNVYDFLFDWMTINNCSTSCRVYLQSLYDFSFSLKYPHCVFESEHDAFISACEMAVRHEFVKIYPTSSMYNQLIQEVNKPSEWSGTGFAIGNGYIVTNNHVVEDASIINVKGVKGDLNTPYSARVVSTDKNNDIAIIKIDDDSFKGFGPIPYGVSSRMGDVGEDIYVLGYPLTQALGNEIKLTNGIISSRSGFQGDMSTYQISAPVTHGNSGGPMFDNKGNVIGVVNSGITYKDLAENVGYAIKISYLKNLIESAGLDIKLPGNNTIANLSLTEKIKRLRNFVFYIECSK